jgi:cytidylate kinase
LQRLLGQGIQALVITVDGPAAAGKSTVAKLLARRLRFRYLDTGAMYRAVTFKALSSRVDLEDREALVRVAGETQIDLVPTEQGLRVHCDGKDVTSELRSPEVTQSIYRIADEPAAREALVKRQRAFARGKNVVAEGRDQGTVVFPEASVKFYLDAATDERARRRLSDMAALGRKVAFDEVKRDLLERDRQDCSRPVGALRKLEDMIVIDSTNRSPREVVDTMVRELEQRGLLDDVARQANGE